MALHPARDIAGKLAIKGTLTDFVRMKRAQSVPGNQAREGRVSQDVQDVGSKIEQVKPHACSFSDSKVRPALSVLQLQAPNWAV